MATTLITGAQAGPEGPTGGPSEAAVANGTVPG